MLAEAHQILLETINYSKSHDSDISSHLSLLFTTCYDHLKKYNGSVIVELINTPSQMAESTLIFDKIGQLIPTNLISINHSKIPNEIKSQRPHFYKMTSLDYAGQHATETSQARIKLDIDILFIDSLHTYDYTLQELKLYLPLLASNGLVILHDTYMSPIQPGFGWKLSNGKVMYGGWDNQRGVSKALEMYFNLKIDETQPFCQVFSDQLNCNWSIEHYPVCNGLTILRKIEAPSQDLTFNAVPLFTPVSMTSCNRMAVIFFHKNIRNIYKPEWIHKSVESVLNQSVQDFDIFEVNYGNQSESLFGDLTQLKANSTTNDRFHYFYEKNYANHTYAMNFILDECFSKGYDLVFNTNLDDYYHSNRFERQKQAITDGYDLVSSLWYYIEDQDGVDQITRVFSPQELNFTTTDQLYLDSNTIKSQLNKDRNVINHSGICLSRNFWNSRDQFGNRLRYRDDLPYEDMTLWTRAINNNSKMTIINDYLINYRIHSNSIGAQLVTQLQVPNKVPRRIGIILVATGKYKAYMENIIVRIEENFCVDYPKTYFITTDDPEIITELEIKLQITGKIVYRIIHRKGFPLDTLYRYHYLLEMKDEILMRSDLVYYFDVDMDVAQKVGTAVIPTGSHVLVGVKHPGSCLPASVGGFQTPNGSPETRVTSTAYIKPSKSVDHYIAGGFNGGLSADFLRMAEVIKANINIDKDNDIIAIWHDESHLNKYLSDNFAKFQILEPSYCYPEDWNYPEFKYERKILALAKNHIDVRNSNQNQVCADLRAGLGNKLFIAAAVLAYAFDHNLQPVFIYTQDPLDKRPSANKYYCFDNLLKIKEPTFNYVNQLEKQFSFQELKFDTNEVENNIRLFGYFQSYKYFYHHKDQIYDMINFSHYERDCQQYYQSITQQIGLDTVSIQVRRTDYVTLSHYFHNLSLNYYQNAVKLFPSNSSFVIFSDDIEWCKQQPLFTNLESTRVYFVDNLNEEFSLLLMSKCKDHIIANSSYGLWASYLGSTSAKTVIPSQWFAAEGPECNLIDFTPPDRQYIFINDLVE